MASINFNDLRKENYKEERYTYADLFLDMEQEPFEVVIGHRTIKGAGKDIKVAYDLNAIKNSIVNLFNTVPGERILLPDYGCDLRKYLFEPVSESDGLEIGRTIKRSIEKWEPRVAVISITVDVYEDTNEYVITLVLQVPFLGPKEKLNLKATLNRQGFVIT